MGCGGSHTAPEEPDDRIYCHVGGRQIKPGMDGIEEWEFNPVQVTVPEGTIAGMPISVQTPHGDHVQVMCPIGISAGDVFQALYYVGADELVNSVGTDWQARSSGSGGGGGGSSRVSLHLCNTCGFGPKSMDCYKCGRRAADVKRVAPACRDCVFGSLARKCAKCDQYFGDGPKHAAILCQSCGFGPDGQDRCAKCGNHCGAFRQQ
jgi:hypothetical protein